MIYGFCSNWRFVMDIKNCARNESRCLVSNGIKIACPFNLILINLNFVFRFKYSFCLSKSMMVDELSLFNVCFYLVKILSVINRILLVRKIQNIVYKLININFLNDILNLKKYDSSNEKTTIVKNCHLFCFVYATSSSIQ